MKGTEFDQAFRELAEDELNVKNVVFTEDARAFTTYNLKPQMRTLGPKYGKLLGGIRTALQGKYGKLLGRIGQHLKEMDGNDVVDAFHRGENVSFTLEGTEVTLSKDDVLTEATQKPGFSAQTDGSVTVVLDCNLTPELIVEGYQREVISKLQNLRKDAGYDVTDHIQVVYQADGELSAAIEAGRDFIMKSVLADELTSGEAVDGKECDINGKKAKLSVQKA